MIQKAVASLNSSQTPLTDANIIRAIYQERGRTDQKGTLVHFSGNSPAVQQSVSQRFRREQQDALNALAKEQTSQPLP